MNTEEFLNTLINYEAYKDPSKAKEKFNIDHLKIFMKKCDNPEASYPIIHVAGTKGKGSTCILLDYCLRKNGFKTGLFTSPHLYQVNERIRINGTPISQNDFDEWVFFLKGKMEELQIPLTYFEFLTILAFFYFKNQNVDYVLLETGLGGRLDSTNLIHQSLAIITTIGLDHVHILGDTKAKIASEKAGIIKENSHTLFMPQEKEVNDVIEKQCQLKNTTLHLVPRPNHQTEINHHYVKKCLEILATRDQWNIQYMPNKEDLFALKIPGRFETFEHNKQTFILDVSHNEISMLFLKKKYHTFFQDTPPLIIFSLARDKDSKAVIRVLKSLSPKIYYLCLDHQIRLMTKEEITAIDPALPILEGLKAIEPFIKTPSSQPILFTGSFYLIGEIGKYFHRNAQLHQI